MRARLLPVVGAVPRRVRQHRRPALSSKEVISDRSGPDLARTRATTRRVHRRLRAAPPRIASLPVAPARLLQTSRFSFLARGAAAAEFHRGDGVLHQMRYTPGTSSSPAGPLLRQPAAAIAGRSRSTPLPAACPSPTRSISRFPIRARAVPADIPARARAPRPSPARRPRLHIRPQPGPRPRSPAAKRSA
jgi:hypothetical protein